MKLVAILVDGPNRYEKDLAQHFMSVSIRNTFPPMNETDVAKIAWSSRAWLDGQQVKGV